MDKALIESTDIANEEHYECGKQYGNETFHIQSPTNIITHKSRGKKDNVEGSVDAGDLVAMVAAGDGINQNEWRK